VRIHIRQIRLNGRAQRAARLRLRLRGGGALVGWDVLQAASSSAGAVLTT
jgi:hypothetical protein